MAIIGYIEHDDITCKNYEICHVIEVSEAMRAYIDNIKEGITRFTAEFDRGIAAMNQRAVLRQRVITFGDYTTQKDQTIRVTPFLDMPEQQDELQAFLDSIDTQALPQCKHVNAYEALSRAVQSDWTVRTDNGPYCYRFIFYYGLSSAWSLHACSGHKGYNDGDYPINVNALSNLCNELDSYGHSFWLFHFSNVDEFEKAILPDCNDCELFRIDNFDFNELASELCSFLYNYWDY